MSSGYSKIPLAKKLGLKADFKIYLFNAPDYYHDLFDEQSDNIHYLTSIKADELDFIHGFFTKNKELTKTVTSLKAGLKQKGILWLSSPKGKSKIETDINREIVRAIVLETGLVDIKVAAIDEDWSGLKFMYELKDRK
ncbi:DUF3052 family protein [Winogradskyella sp. PG-2]|uniref:DUF3052 family protein n=1 Tax=Winogradskyella sp. PG-2 TaxID=754409 RepID=UPI00045899DF|nr:DUF3052 family protein [Winogradskyella sp. PG-2]BAO77173.1 mll4262 protein [Winogradskyella sp. PG-2]